jgi:hypothetical protein
MHRVATRRAKNSTVYIILDDLPPELQEFVQQVPDFAAKWKLERESTLESLNLEIPPAATTGAVAPHCNAAKVHCSRWCCRAYISRRLHLFAEMICCC